MTEMRALIDKIKSRLSGEAYPNEASVSVGIVMPLLTALGRDSSDPDQVKPEFSSGRGRVDFALCSPARKPAIFIEVKGVGRSLDGDRQLFEYAFHEGVPLCILTDGREWSFYLPSGQGNYEERRVYRLQLDERSAEQTEAIFDRYLRFDHVRSGKAFENASSDYRDGAARRAAKDAIPAAWAELISEPEELLVELISDKAEALCGYRPTAQQVAAFLMSGKLHAVGSSSLIGSFPTRPPADSRTNPKPVIATTDRVVAADGPSANVLGNMIVASNGNRLLVEVLRRLASAYPDQIAGMAEAVRGRSRNHIGRTPAEIYPGRPDLARAAEFAPGWLVGLNIANREKVGIVRDICRVLNLRFGKDVEISLPNI